MVEGELLSTQPAINGKEIFELLRDDLSAIEREFGRDTVSNVPAITDIGEYLRGGGGKRIEPRGATCEDPPPDRTPTSA